MGGGELGGFADGLRFGVGQVAGEGEMEAGSEGALGFGNASGEAMHDAAEVVRGPVLGDEVEDVLPGVGGTEFLFGLGCRELAGAAVNEDGLARGGGDLHLGEEGLFLDVGGGVFEVVVIEADLADGDAAGVGGEGREFFQGFGGGAGSFLGVDSGAGVEGWESEVVHSVGDVEGLVHGAGAFADADGENGVDSGRVGSTEDFGAVCWCFGVEVEMCVGVDEWHGFLRVEHVGKTPAVQAGGAWCGLRR